MADAAHPLVLRSARLRGVEGPVDLRLEGGRIAVIGQTSDVTHPSAEVIDLEGRLVAPGLWDEHVHVTQWALTSRRLDVGVADSALAASRIVAAAVASGDADSLIIGYGFRDGLWPDEPEVRLLDEAAPDQSVVLVSGDLHCVWLNSRAAAEFGVAVPGSGLLYEDAAFAVERALENLPPALIDSWAAQAGRRAAARGVVGIADLEMRWNRDDWLRRRAGGFDSQRIRFAVYPADLERAVEEGLRSFDRLDELLEVGHLKILIDGSLNTRTAYCFTPYPDADGGNGMLTVPQDELEAVLRRARDGRLVPTVHAIGDRALTIALDTFDRVGGGGRVEHAQLIAEDDLGRFAELGVTASMQPAHLLDDRDVADHHWAGRTSRAFPLRSLLDSGARLAFGSDAPVSPLDPWVTMAAAVFRTRDGREPWHPEQRVTVDEALAASTGEPKAVEVGGPADLAVLDGDPWSATESELRTMPVAATLLAGRFTHRAL